jgi:hypothetical protein
VLPTLCQFGKKILLKMAPQKENHKRLSYPYWLSTDEADEHLGQLFLVSSGNQSV